MHRAEVRIDDQLLLELSIRSRKTEPTSRLFQCFTQQDNLYQAPVWMQGWLAEHEEEAGLLKPGEHPWGLELDDMLDDVVPFREQFVEGGQEDFGEMEIHT